MQNRLPPGATIVPLICGSDERQLTDLPAAKNPWPIYPTIGNIHSSIWNKYSYLAQIVLAFLPLLPKFQRNSASDDRAQRDINQQVLCDIAKIVLELVTWYPEGVEIISSALWPCSDRTMHCCWPILASWLVDHLQHANLMGVKYNASHKCQTPKDELQSLILQPDLESHWRKSAVFQQKYWKYQNAKTARDCQAMKFSQHWLESVSARPIPSIFWDLPHVEANDLHRPDIFCNICIGMFHHLMSWIEGFLQRHGQAVVFDQIWAGNPPYPNFYHCGKGYQQILQWSGKGMRNFGVLIYPAWAAALHDPLPCHQAVFQRASTSIRSLVNWSLVVQYRTHPTETLNYLVDYLQECNATKNVFTTYQTSNTTDSIAHACMKNLKMQLKAEHAIEHEERAARGEPPSHAQKEHCKAEYKKCLQDVYNSTVHEHTSFNFGKTHLMLHYEESVQRFGHLVKDSTETQEMN